MRSKLRSDPFAGLAWAELYMIVIQDYFRHPVADSCKLKLLCADSGFCEYEQCHYNSESIVHNDLELFA